MLLSSGQTVPCGEPEMSGGFVQLSELSQESQEMYDNFQCVLCLMNLITSHTMSG